MTALLFCQHTKIQILQAAMTVIISKPSKELLSTAAEFIMLLMEGRQDLIASYLFETSSLINTKQFECFLSLLLQSNELRKTSDWPMPFKLDNLEHTYANWDFRITGVYMAIESSNSIQIGISIVKLNALTTPENYVVALPKLQTKHDVLAYLQSLDEDSDLH